jgi:alpha-acetolactate decarboxylase
MKYLIIILLAISIASCESKDGNSCELGYEGALKNIMHKGDISAKADLKTFENIKHLYAIGALENLKGEIQIFDSKSFNSLVVDNTLFVENTFDKKATLLVYASVSEWILIDVPENIITYKQLEEFISQAAGENQINVNEPFVFLLEGTPESLDWHVINWKEGDTEHTHEKHVNSGLHGTINNTPAKMLGFYSDSHHAIFTHHTTNMHIHVKTNDNKIAGHVDGLKLGKGMILKLPVCD